MSQVHVVQEHLVLMKELDLGNEINNKYKYIIINYIMSQIRFELNINEYTPQELEELLHLKYPYTHEDIEDRLDQLKTKIKADTNLNKNKLEEFFNFLGFVDNAVNKHLLDIKNKVDKNVIHQYGSNIIIDRDTLRKKDPMVFLLR